MKKTQILGREVGFRKWGSGAPIVLIHGYGGSHLDWEEAGHTLAESFTVYLPHFTHHYLDPNTKLSFGALIDFVTTFVEAVVEEHQQPVVLVGSSFGAAICWGVAIRKPELLSKMILVSPMPPNPRKRLTDWKVITLLNMARVPASIGVLMSSPVGRLILPHLEEVFQLPGHRKERLRRVLLTKRLVKMVTHSVARFEWLTRSENWGYWESRLSGVKTATLILTGKRDPLFKENESRRFFQCFPNAELITVADGGHVMSREMPTEIAAQIIKFIGSYPQRRAVTR